MRKRLDCVYNVLFVGVVGGDLFIFFLCFLISTLSIYLSIKTGD
jgi:hypothetical protein